MNYSRSDLLFMSVCDVAEDRCQFIKAHWFQCWLMCLRDLTLTVLAFLVKYDRPDCFGYICKHIDAAISMVFQQKCFMAQTFHELFPSMF